MKLARCIFNFLLQTTVMFITYKKTSEKYTDSRVEIKNLFDFDKRFCCLTKEI